MTQALLGTTTLVHGLLRMVAALQDRCQELEDAAEVAAVQAEVRAYAWAEDQLRESERLLGLAVAALDSARAEREQAEEIRAAAEQLADRHRRALEGLNTATTAWQETDPLAAPTADLPIEAFGAALEQAHDALGIHAAELREARDHMGIPQPDLEAENIVRGQVVDNTDYLLAPPNPKPETTQTQSAEVQPAAEPDPEPVEHHRLPDPAEQPNTSSQPSLHGDLPAPNLTPPMDEPQTLQAPARRSTGAPLGYTAAVELSSDALVQVKRPIWGSRRTSKGKGREGLLDDIRSRQRRLLDAIRLPVQRSCSIVVVSGKGGVGKTTTVTALGSVLAACRQDKILAMDVNPDAGSLGRRLRRETGATIYDFVRALPHLHSYMDVRRFTSQNPQGLEVIANDMDPSIAEQLTSTQYTEVLRAFASHYSFVLTDTGTALRHEVMKKVLSQADQLVIVAAPNVDGAATASLTVDILQQDGHGALVANAVVAVNASHGSVEGINVAAITRHFQSACRTVVEIPFDEHLAHGAEVDLQRMRSKTRQAYVELTAAVAQGLGSAYAGRQ
ncbi:AAA family ATPase [Streptomyces adustus]|uniref:AAA family ATPase n=2 Tax=Streptomyces adustus TaxID=1609272 RepID=A0A5N8VEQ0_9ACTN|nr:AAA family ATPase [Streptomyces adustus]